MKRLFCVWMRPRAVLLTILLVILFGGCGNEDQEALVSSSPAPTSTAPTEPDSSLAAAPEAQEPIIAVGRIDGMVVDEDGNGVAMASVLVEGTMLGAATDGGGRFMLTRIPEGSVVLDVRGAGRQVRHPVEVLRDSTITARIQLH